MNKNLKNKNKGFTLIELLAVIVILAVIALIAAPQILNILNRARLSAAEDTTNGIIKSSENYVTSFMLKNNGSFPEETLTFECTTDGCILQTELNGYNKENLTTLDFKGTKPNSGTVTISNSGKNIIANNLKINGFTCIYDGEKSTCGDYKDRIVLKEDFDKKGILGGYEGVLAIVYLDPTDLSKECNVNNLVEVTGTGSKEGCMKWYAYKDENGKYTMIADHNITENVAWYVSSRDNTKGPKEALEALSEATTNWSDKLVAPGAYTASWTYNGESNTYTIDYLEYGNKARLISAEEVAEITGASKSVEDGGIGWNLNWNVNNRGYYFDSTGDKWQILTSNSQVKNKYAWLFDNTIDCTNYGCNVEKSGTHGYWTSSPNNIFAWFISKAIMSGSVTDHTNSYGLRPVITIRKSDLLQQKNTFINYFK